MIVVCFKIDSEAFVFEESGAEQKEEEEEVEEEEVEGGCNACRGGLTLHPLLALALLFVLLLEFGYQAGVHVPGLRNGALLVLLYTGQQTNADLGSAAASHSSQENIAVFFFLFLFSFYK